MADDREQQQDMTPRVQSQYQPRHTPPVMTTEGLKPCPFCGGEATQFTYPAECSTNIRCMSCGASARAHSGQEQHLTFAAWNRRVG